MCGALHNHYMAEWQTVRKDSINKDNFHFYDKKMTVNTSYRVLEYYVCLSACLFISLFTYFRWVIVCFKEKIRGGSKKRRRIEENI